MATPGRRNHPSVSRQLADDPTRFDLFQAVRVLEWLAREHAADHPERMRRPVGEDHAPRQEVVRFRAVPSMSFPAASIAQLAPPQQNDEASAGPPEMAVAAMGLTGPSGALPHHYTSMLIERVRLKDHALRDFLDLFNHRTISLFYRAWEKHHFPFAYERGRRIDQTEEDLFTRCLYGLVGLGTGGLRDRLAVDDEAVLFYGGYYAHWPRSAQSLERLLADYFEVPVEVRQFQGAWLYLAPEDQSAMPFSGKPGQNNRLGESLLAGSRVWDVENRFRIRLGPLGYRQFCRFLPSGDALKPLVHLTRLYVGPQLDFDVQLVLSAKEVPWCRLGDRTNPSRAGWNTWIRARDFDHDADDPVFTLEA